LDDPLIWSRAIHFAATVSVAGVVFFHVFIAAPVFGKSGDRESALVALCARFAWIAGSGLIIAVLSGAAWLVLQAQQMSDSPLQTVFSDGIVWMVLSGTDFGRDWVVRFVLAVLLASILPSFLSSKRPKPPQLPIVAALLAASLVGTLAWAGHGAAGEGVEGTSRLTADILHLIAAAAWLGALIPLAMLLAATDRNEVSLAVARQAVLRFSTLGIGAVGTLLVTGLVNAWSLVGTVTALFRTTYGQLLLLKLALFLLMVSIAAINRFLLTPRLLRWQETAARHPLRQLRNNAFLEAAIGAAIITAVAVLGTLEPAAQELATG